MLTRAAPPTRAGAGEGSHHRGDTSGTVKKGTVGTAVCAEGGGWEVAVVLNGCKVLAEYGGRGVEQAPSRAP